MKFNLFFVLFTFLAHRFLSKYDFRMQLLMFQISMLRDRIEDQHIVPTPEERAELLRLGNEINHNVADSAAGQRFLRILHRQLQAPVP
jgi:putative transposase